MITEAVRRRRVEADDVRPVRRAPVRPRARPGHLRPGRSVRRRRGRASRRRRPRPPLGGRGDLPTPAEVDAPGLWLARIELDPTRPDPFPAAGSTGSGQVAPRKADQVGRRPRSGTAVVAGHQRQRVRRGSSPLRGRARVQQALTVDALGVHGLVAVAEDDEVGVGEPAPHAALAARPWPRCRGPSRPARRRRSPRRAPGRCPPARRRCCRARRRPGAKPASSSSSSGTRTSPACRMASARRAAA